MKTITRADVAETIYEEIGLSRKDSNDILDMILDEIVQELSAGNDVKLSSFGTFALQKGACRPQSENRRRSRDFTAPGYLV